jgi:hypothetical protein
MESTRPKLEPRLVPIDYQLALATVAPHRVEEERLTDACLGISASKPCFGSGESRWIVGEV